MRPARFLAATLSAACVLAACGDDTPDRSGTAASIEFATPTDGETVSNPIEWEADVTNFTIEQAGAVTEGAGHLHIMVDTECVKAGEVIPNDDQHQHFGDGSTSGTLKTELSPGEHTLCLQAADGEHTALDLTHEVTITVE